MNKTQKISALIWLTIIVLTTVLLYFNPHYLSADYLQSYFGNNFVLLLVLYIIISLVRGFFLLPSTPFVILGGVLFPQYPFYIFSISLVCIVFSAFIIYFFAEKLGFDKALENKFPKQLEKPKIELQKPRAIFLVIFWSMFPAVPTDLICYVAGVIKMPFKRLALGLTIGEIPLVYAYVYLGKSIWQIF